MADISSGGANRIELESQILCASLRQSWSLEDVVGVITAARQLYQLFPDLLPILRPSQKEAPFNYYEFLSVDIDASQAVVIAAYLKLTRLFRQQRNPKEYRDDYWRMLDGGYILRKPRLRLSHDLMVVRHWLLERKAIPEDGTIDFIEPSQALGPSQLLTTQELTPNLPVLVELLRESQIVGPAEVQALTNQMSLAPEIPIQELVLSAGYVTEVELKSLQLAEYLLAQGKITMAQFAVAMYDERTQGIRMAESLQVRGWLETHVKTYGDEGKGKK